VFLLLCSLLSLEHPREESVKCPRTKRTFGVIIVEAGAFTTGFGTTPAAGVEVEGTLAGLEACVLAAGLITTGVVALGATVGGIGGATADMIVRQRCGRLPRMIVGGSEMRGAL
jgi:hypothetical protein